MSIREILLISNHDFCWVSPAVSLVSKLREEGRAGFVATGERVGSTVGDETGRERNVPATLDATGWDRVMWILKYSDVKI